MRTTRRLVSLAISAGMLVTWGCATGQAPSNAAVAEAFRAHRSRVEVTFAGVVTRVLGERTGPRGLHAGFLVRLDRVSPPLTVRVEDNEDITGPIPLRPGERVEIRGEYIYDPRGGLVHYTHHDPRFRHPAGYVRAGTRFYQ